MSDYFKKLPIVDYDGSFVRNILSRVVIDDQKSLNYYYDYLLKDEDTRMDIVADKYYDDPTDAYLIYLANKVVDPYHDLGLTEENFAAYINTKYGSQANAQGTVVFYRNAWRDDDSVLNSVQYNSLPDSVKKYYDFTLNYNLDVTGYERKQEDWVVSTNKMISLAWANTTFQEGDRVSQGGSRGFVKSSNATHVVLQHIQGTFSPNSQVTSVTLLAQPISDTEAYLWEEVDAFTYEQELNEAKRNIRLIDNRFASQVEEDIEKLLNG